MNNNILPFFKTDASLGKSILTSDAPDAINIDKPISVWSIAKEHQLDTVYIVEDSMVSFPNHYKFSKKLNKQLVFGIRFYIVNNRFDNSEKSFSTQSNVIVFMNNSDGYYDLIKLYSAIFSDAQNYIWHKHEMKAYYRGDWELLLKYLTPNLTLVIPFYDSFIFKNLLVYGSNSIPEFRNIKPYFCIENHELPFDYLVKDKVLQYCKEYNCPILNSHTIYYYNDSDATAFQIFKCINNRSSFENPELNSFSSDKFSFESFKKLVYNTSI